VRVGLVSPTSSTLGKCGGIGTPAGSTDIRCNSSASNRSETERIADENGLKKIIRKPYERGYGDNTVGKAKAAAAAGDPQFRRVETETLATVIFPTSGAVLRTRIFEVSRLVTSSEDLNRFPTSNGRLLKFSWNKYNRCFSIEVFIESHSQVPVRGQNNFLSISSLIKTYNTKKRKNALNRFVYLNLQNGCFGNDYYFKFLSVTCGTYKRYGNFVQTS